MTTLLATSVRFLCTEFILDFEVTMTKLAASKMISNKKEIIPTEKTEKQGKWKRKLTNGKGPPKKNPYNLFIKNLSVCLKINFSLDRIWNGIVVSASCSGCLFGSANGTRTSAGRSIFLCCRKIWPESILNWLWFFSRELGCW